jgi:predicted lipoprotein with Yx(FWY)xxD motif
MVSFRKLLAAMVAVALFASACSSAAAPQSVLGATSVPQATATVGATTAPAASSAAASSSGASSAAATTVMAVSIGGANTLVGGNGMTLYSFSKDTANSGTSACTGGCATKWPPLTVAAGTTPSAGAGASGKLGTISRADGTTQVTYNGLPVYFYSGDTAAGDTNGNYPGWVPVAA